ncbi:UNVERIFIED_CONTAM: hypothetical protein KB582_00215 [Streptococcus canis]
MSRVKRKLVLGISHLSVAMLGASLLVANPVSAEEMSESQGQTVDLTTQNSSNGIVEVIEVTEDGEEYIVGSTQHPYLKGREDGYNAGYQDGQDTDASETPNDAIPEPQTTPSYKDEGKKQDYDDGYRDAYALGYRNGWDDNHYIWSTFKRMWYWFTGLFYSSSTR